MRVKMMHLLLAACLLATVGSAPTDEKKLPEWPKSFSITILTTLLDDDSSSRPVEERVIRAWTDGDTGNEKVEEFGATLYKLNYNNGSAQIQFDSMTGDCDVSYSSKRVESSTPTFSKNIKFVGVNVVNGETVDVWMDKSKQSDRYTKIYMKQQEGVMIPVRVEWYKNDQVAYVVEVLHFSPSKPDASEFDVDASECKVISDTT